MKYLKIENNKGFFLKQTESPSVWLELDKINKDDLLSLLDLAVSSDFEMDEYSETNISNKAHQIIYKNIYEKFKYLLSMKSKFKDESESYYKEAMEKYINDNEPEKKN